MRRGEVYWADLAPRSGSEQSGRRLVILVSNDGFNQARAKLTKRLGGCPLASSRK